MCVAGDGSEHLIAVLFCYCAGGDGEGWEECLQYMFLGVAP